MRIELVEGLSRSAWDGGRRDRQSSTSERLGQTHALGVKVCSATNSTAKHSCVGAEQVGLRSVVPRNLLMASLGAREHDLGPARSPAPDTCIVACQCRTLPCLRQTACARQDSRRTLATGHDEHVSGVPFATPPLPAFVRPAPFPPSRLPRRLSVWVGVGG